MTYHVQRLPLVGCEALLLCFQFFVNNPSVRKDEVFQATENYLKSVSEPIYCKKSHKFIYEIDGTSMLKDYVDGLSRAQEVKRADLEDVI